jgi:hypothetical protein
MSVPEKPKRCLQCASRRIQLEDYDDEFIYIYCEDCEESFEIPRRIGGNSQYSHDGYYQEDHNNDITDLL